MQSERLRKRALSALNRALAQAQQNAAKDPQQLTAVAHIAGAILTKVEEAPRQETCPCRERESWPTDLELWQYIRDIVEKRMDDDPENDGLIVFLLLVALEHDRVRAKLLQKLNDLCDGGDSDVDPPALEGK